jgi:hypothetical protein
MRDPVLQINRVPYSIAEEEAVELILAADSGAGGFALPWSSNSIDCGFGLI